MLYIFRYRSVFVKTRLDPASYRRNGQLQFSDILLRKGDFSVSIELYLSVKTLVEQTALIKESLLQKLGRKGNNARAADTRRLFRIADEL